MHDSRSWTSSASEFARRRMSLVPNIHLVHLAIVMGRDEVHILDFHDPDEERMLAHTLPGFVREADAVGVILTSPARDPGRDGAIVTLMERTIETFYVPIVRITNLDWLIGDFRSINPVEPDRRAPILDELVANWLKRETA